MIGDKRKLFSHVFVVQSPSKDFAGARDISVVHSLMTKWALLAVTGFLGCSASLSAQETQRSVPFTLSQPGRNVMGSHGDLLSMLSNSYYNTPSLMLLDGRPLSLSNGYDWIEPMPPDFLPELSAEPARVSTARARRDSRDKTLEVQPKFFDYVHGEVGVLYGTSTGGKFSRELEQGYIFGEMGNDKTHIIVGASYEHSSGHVPRFGR